MSNGETLEFPTSEPVWDLDSIFPGGASSEEFEEFLGEIGTAIEALTERIETADPLAAAETADGAVVDQWVEILADKQEIDEKLRQARSFAGAVSAAHADDPEAASLPSEVGEYTASADGLRAELVAGLAGAGDRQFEWLGQRPSLEGLGLYLRELRREAERALSPEEEELLAELQRDGLHAWGDLYQLTSGRLEVEVDDPDTGERETLSVGQAKNRLSAAERGRRRSAHDGLRSAWSERAPMFASILNSILGSRQTACSHRDLDVLTEPLEDNRIERGTLRAMFEAATEFQPVLHKYLSLKADALGLERLEWYDLQATPAGGSASDIDYEEAQRFIVEQVEAFSDRWARFYRRAFGEQWVEAEDRSGKAQGAFCATFPVDGEVRVFTTFSGTMSGVTTLAHELGHAYHGWLMREMRPAARVVPMTLAESASTLSEKVVESAALERAEGARRLDLLDQRLQRAVTFLLDIPARFDLEVEMYRLRREGRLEPRQLTALTRNAFRARFGDRVASFDDYFWASKLHYYMTRAPFYNFPYTFGYLFSKALYGEVRERGDGASEMVDALLRDSGRLSAEDLAERYLGADLSDSDFWVNAASSIAEDVSRYESLVE